MSNYVLALIKAVQGDQGSIENQQITDAKTTEIAAQIETNIYDSWKVILKADSGEVAKYADKGTSKKDQNEVNKWQTNYNAASAQAQSEESQQDGVVQGSQQQTSSDASNLQMKAQMVQSVNSILTTVSGMLGRITA